jgi:hypothetical protein
MYYIFAIIVSKNLIGLLFIIHQNITAHIIIQIYLGFKGFMGKSKHDGYHGANIYYLIYQNKNGMLDHYCSVHIHS